MPATDEKMNFAYLIASSCEAVMATARTFSTLRRAPEDAVQELKHFRVSETVRNGGCGVASCHRYRYHYRYRFNSGVER